LLEMGNRRLQKSANLLGGGVKEGRRYAFRRGVVEKRGLGQVTPHSDDQKRLGTKTSNSRRVVRSGRTRKSGVKKGGEVL